MQRGEAEVVHDHGVLRDEPPGHAGRQQAQEIPRMAGAQVC